MKKRMISDWQSQIREMILKSVSPSQKKLSRQMIDWREAAAHLGAVASQPNRFDRMPEQSEAGIIDVVDVFCGCGGTSAGFKILSGLQPFYRLAGAIDINLEAGNSYERNLGIRPLHSDLAKIVRSKSGIAEIRKKFGLTGKRPLVLVGCAPCQGFSAHRKKDKRVDPRNSLVVDFAVMAVSLRPDVVVMENVPELLTGKYRSLYDAAEEKLLAAGYSVQSHLVNMAEYGVPQKRIRAVVLAFKAPFRMPRGHLNQNGYVSVRSAIGDLPKLVPGTPCPSDSFHVTASHRPSTISVIRQVPKDGGSRPKGVGPRCLDKVNGFYDVYGRLRWNDPAITITAYARNPASGRYVHPEQNRGLSAREAAVLQGFPRWYEFTGSFDEWFSQIGNAVPPMYAVRLAAHILGELAEIKGNNSTRINVYKATHE